jgi:hypothetical protein
MVVAFGKLGNGDIFRGFEAVNNMPYFDARRLVTHPVACIDCHNPENDAASHHAPRVLGGHSRLEGGSRNGGSDE